MSTTVSVGSVRWGVKSSFVRYVRLIAAGTCEAAGGASLDADDVFEFPVVETTQSDGMWTLSCGGSARFNAHHGFLDVVLSRLRIELGSEGGSIGIGAGPGEWVVIATVPPASPVGSDGRLSWSGVVPSLTDVGSEVLGSVYPAGSELAPLDVALPID
ncbi:MAG: HtaA domain-containing protein [Nocardioides sp.]|uniref:HtaA domain-containing protein n=1 Tax=Nocardioides sp. TaxID=35761 RepID=UPI0039E56E46